MMHGTFDDDQKYYGDKFSVAMFAKVISPACKICERFEADTIAIQNTKVIDMGDGNTKSVPNGIVNHIQCAHFEECKHIFEDGYKVIKETSEVNNYEKLLQYVAECKQKKMTEIEIARSLGESRAVYRGMLARAKKEVNK